MSVVFPRGLLRARLHFDIGRKDQSIVLHFVPPGVPWGPSDLETFAGNLGEWWAEPGGPWPAPNSYQSSAVAFTLVALHFVPGLPTIYGALATKLLVAIVGQQPNPGVPCDSAPVLRLDTTGPFRRGNGRVYFPGIAAATLDGNQQDSLNANIAANLCNTFAYLPTFLADSYPPGASPTWVVWNRSRQSGGPDAMPTVSAVTGVRMPSLTLGSQRLRLRGQRKVYVPRDEGLPVGG